jgi:hypothetical protein
MVYTWRNRHIRYLSFNEAWLQARMAAYETLEEKGRDLVVDILKIFGQGPAVGGSALAEGFQRSVLGLTAALEEARLHRIYREALKSYYRARGHLARLDALLTAAEQLDYMDADIIARLAGALAAVTEDLEAVIKEYEWYVKKG